MIEKFRINSVELLTNANKDIRLDISVFGEDKQAARECVAKVMVRLASGKNQMTVGFEDYKKERTLNANSYFHLLVDKIAKAMELGADEVKNQMVLEYGAIELDNEGVKIGFKLPSGVDVNKVCKYAKWFDSRIENGKTFDCYIVYKETHTMDKNEFKALLEGVVWEAQELGIETKTPEEIANMVSLWEGK